MPKPKRPASLNTAECARRTGLTVRVARLRAPRAHQTGTVGQRLAALRSERTPASEPHRDSQDVRHDAGADPLTTAQEASPWHQALRQTADEAAKLVDSKVNPSSAPAMVLANRLARICADHSLGDPLVYARWAGAMQFPGSADENARRKSTWEYLASALQAHAPRAP
jgi:hypothetical protein